MGTGHLARDGKAKPGAASAGGAGEGLKQVLPRAGRQTRPIVADAQRQPLPVGGAVGRGGGGVGWRGGGRGCVGGRPPPANPRAPPPSRPRPTVISVAPASSALRPR